MRQLDVAAYRHLLYSGYVIREPVRGNRDLAPLCGSRWVDSSIYKSETFKGPTMSERLRANRYRSSSPWRSRSPSSARLARLLERVP